MENKKIKITCIADIHLGILDSNEMLENLKSVFISYCEQEKPDIIVLCGDTLHEKVSLNSTTAKNFILFIDLLRKLNTTILIIHGTKSHDEFQYDIFSSYLNDDFRIYNKACSDYVKGLKLLLIPEEYMIDPKSYYSDLLSSKYDFCFGHGQFNHVSFVGKTSSFKKLTAPLWDYEKQFKDNIFGRVVFGHEHTYNHIDKFYYVSSFGRYSHGQEEPKGFMTFEYDINKKSIIKEEFIENKEAKIFKTILESNLSIDRNDLINELSLLTKKSYKLRIRLDREISIERKSDIISFCKNNLNTSIDLYYDRKLKIAKSIEFEINKSLIENKYENMDIVDATIEYILEKYNISFNKETILKILNNGDIYDN